MAFCENCGTQLQDVAVFCPNCGAPRGGDAPSVQTPLQEASYQAPPAEPVYQAPPAGPSYQAPPAGPVYQTPPGMQMQQQQPSGAPYYGQPYAQPQGMMQEAPQKKKSKAPLIIILVLLLLIIGGVVAWLFLFGPFSKTKKIVIPGDWEGVANYTNISGTSDNSDRTVNVYGYFDRDNQGAYFQLYEDAAMRDKLIMTLYVDDTDLTRFSPRIEAGGAFLMDMPIAANQADGLRAPIENGELRLKCTYTSGDLSIDCEFVLHAK